MRRRDLIKGMAAAGAATVISTRGAAAQDGRQALAGAKHRANVWSAAKAVDPLKWYEPGNGGLGPATSTDDYYHAAGLYWFRPYDLLSWGSEGAAMAALYGHRYFWATGPDHPVSNYWVWRGSADFMVGFSDDPGVFPETLRGVAWWNNRNPGLHDTYPSGTWGAYEYAYCTYNPDDADDMPFYMYMEGAGISGAPIQHNTTLFRSNNLLTWVAKRISHSAATSNGWSSFHAPQRWRTNDWRSVGLGGEGRPPGNYQWTSTDGISFTSSGVQTTRYRKISDGTTYTLATLPRTLNTGISEFGRGPTETIDIGGQLYYIGLEYVGVWLSSGNTKPQYVSLFACDEDGNYNPAGAPAPTRLAGPYSGKFPGPGWVQSVNIYQEDEIAHIYVMRGVHGPVNVISTGWPYATKAHNHGQGGGASSFSGTVTYPPMHPGTTTLTAYYSGVASTVHDNGAGEWIGGHVVRSSINYTTGAYSFTLDSPPDTLRSVEIRYVEDKARFTEVTGNREQGGGCSENWYDYHTYIFDADTAAGHAPVGVTATCDGGVVTLFWYDALPHQNYRVYYGSTAESQTSPLGGGSGNVSGLGTTDTPGVTGQRWYRVVTLNSGVRAGERVVHCYVSSASELANKHINRVINDGGDITKINVSRLEAAITMLEDQGWMSDLLFWASPEFGIKESGGHLVKIYCLGTTRLPRGGDLTFHTSTTTHSATGVGGTRPAFVNANTNSHGYFGGDRFNPIRRKRQITVAAMYERTQTSSDITFVGMNTNVGAMDDNYVGTEVNGLSLSHNAGTPGTIEFVLKDDEYGLGTRQNTATVASDGEAVQVSVGVYNGTEMVAYCNGVTGTPNSDPDPNPYFMRSSALAGARGARLSLPVLGVGSRSSSYTQPSSPSTFTAGTRVFPANEAKFNASDIVILGLGLDQDGVNTLTKMLQSSPVASVGYVIPLRRRLRAP